MISNKVINAPRTKLYLNKIPEKYKLNMIATKQS